MKIELKQIKFQFAGKFGLPIMLLPLPLLLSLMVMLVAAVVLLVVEWTPPIIEDMAAASAAVKFGSAVMAALTVLANDGGCWAENWAESMLGDI